MKRIEFKTKTAQRIYNSYFNRAKKYLKKLSKEDSNDLVMELNSHIYEGIARNPKQADESAALLDVLERLGEPTIYLKPMVAERKAAQAARTFNPIDVFQAIVLNIGNGFIYLVCGFLFLIVLVFIATFFYELIAPEQVGLFIGEDTWVIGNSDTFTPDEERLGRWLLPFSALISIGSYFLITLLLKLRLKKRS